MTRDREALIEAAMRKWAEANPWCDTQGIDDEEWTQLAAAVVDAITAEGEGSEWVQVGWLHAGYRLGRYLRYERGQNYPIFTPLWNLSPKAGAEPVFVRRPARESGPAESGPSDASAAADTKGEAE